MRRIYTNRGSISIILLIILLPTLVFSGLMIDIARHHLSKASLKQANKLTLNSVLADYDTVLKDVYGLFAISQDPLLSDRMRSDLIMEQLNVNMRNIFLASPVLEDIRISYVPTSSYSNPEVIEKGILEFMKYRGPAEIALSLLDSFEVFTKIGEQSRVAEHKMDMELGYRDISAECAELYRTITVYDSHVEMYMAAENHLRDCISRIAQCPDTESEEYMAAYDEVLRGFHTWKELSPAEMAAYAISEGSRFQESLGQLEQMKGEFRQSVEEYGRTIDEDPLDGFYNTMSEEMNRYDEEISFERVEGLLEQLRAAKRYLNMQSFETVEEYISTVHKQNQYYHSENAYLKLIGEVIYTEEAVIGVPAFYVMLLSSFGSDTDGGEGAFGNGKSLKKGIREINEWARNGASVEAAYAYSSYLFKNVPSGQVDSIPAAFDRVDEGGWYGAVSQYREMSSKVTGLLEVFEAGAKGLMNNLYTSEYIMRNFSYLTSNADQMTMTGVPIDPEHNLIYGCEAEYILFGSKGCAEKKLLWFTIREEAGPESNLATAKTNIFAIRFVCNSVYALTDSSIDEMTLAPALAIQAASGGILPYQLAQLIIKLALALAESAIDLDQLIQGERVALMKSSSTWRCSFQGIIDMLKDRVSVEISELVDEGVRMGVGYLQRCIDDTAGMLNTKINDSIDEISLDIETAISAELDQAVSGIMSALLEFAHQEFDNIFTTGYFDREQFVQSARTKVRSLMQGAEFGLYDVLLNELPFIEDNAIIQLADTLESVLSDSDDTIKLDQIVCSKVTSELNKCVSTSMCRIKDSMKLEVNQIIISAGDTLNDSMESYGDMVSEEAAEKLTGEAIRILNHYIPADMYTSEDIVGLDTELCEMKPGRINEKILCLSYGDHLQILLILKLCSAKRDEILLRVADIMQLNVSLSHKKGHSFRMADAYTCVEIREDMRISSLLLPSVIFDTYVDDYDSTGY